MAAFKLGFSKPENFPLGVNPAGGTSPTRELIGNTASAASAGVIASAAMANAPNRDRGKRMRGPFLIIPIVRLWFPGTGRATPGGGPGIHRRKMGDNAAAAA